MNDAKECYIGHLSCKSHAAKTEKDLYRICPSKLSKRELEDLYFALLEQNVQLKKTINEQRDQIKLLNTRVQRMTVQKPMSGFHNKDCCAGTKAIINEQRESIADLKKANERLSERLRVLNMRLCSAKQFLRRGSSQAATHCSKCLVSSDSIKNSSMSALNTKRSDTRLGIESSPYEIEKDHIKIQLGELVVPTQLAEIVVPTQLAEIVVPTELSEIAIPTQSAGATSSRADTPIREDPCQRNECRTEIDELKLKIVALQEEVSDVRQSHSQRMRVLEAAQAQLGARRQTDELSAQLQQQLARTNVLRSSCHIDDAADAGTTNRTLPLVEAGVSEPGLSERGSSPPIVVRNNSGISIFIEDKCHKDSDDSGFSDFKNRDVREEKERTLQERDHLIENQIANMQSQLLNMKVNAATETELPAVTLETESSLSHNIFSTSRLKTLKEIDKVPSTSHEPDVRINDLSMNGLKDEHSHKSEKTQKYGHVFEYNIPAPPSLDMPRMILGDNEADFKILENEAASNNSDDIKSNKGNIKTNSNNVKRNEREPVDGDKNTIIDSLDKSNQIIKDIIEDGKTSDPTKKNRRSSLKLPYEGKHSRDVGVRYGETRAYESSADTETNAKNVSRGTDIDKVYFEPDDDQASDPSEQYKINERASIRRIRYTSDVRTDSYEPREQKPTAVDPASTTADGAGRGAHDAGIQCLRDDTLHNSCDEEQVVSCGPDGALLKGTIAVVEANGLVLCAGLSRVCECPPDSVPGPVSLRTCSGASTLPPARGDRYRVCACGSETQPSLSSPEPRRSPKEPPRTPSELRNSSPERHRSPTKPRPSSPERSDREVSSLTDPTCTNDTRSSDCISPGEEKATSTHSDTCGTADGGSLSEGEVPSAAGGKRLSATVDNMTESVGLRGSRSDKMEEALRAIGVELTRCRELLQKRGEKVREEEGESS